MNRWMKYGIIFVALFIVGSVFYNKVYIPKSTYVKVRAQRGAMDVYVFGIGNVGAKNIYAVNALSAAKILEIKKDAGEWVKKGELLVVMDPVDLPQLLEEAKIAVKKASLELIAFKKELQSLIAQKNLVQLTYERYAKLKEQSFASQSEYDKAKADLDAIDAQIEATKARIDSAKAEVRRAKKSTEALAVKLSRYKITAPVDGYIIAREADVAESVVPTQAILKIVDPKTVWIKAYIDEKISGNIKVGQKAKITLRSRSNEKFSGYVSRIVPQSDAVTGEREVDVMFEKLPIPFYINEQAEVLIATKKLKNVLKIPLNVLVHKKSVTGVWVDKDGRASFKELQILAVSDNEVAVANIDNQVKIILPAQNKKPLFEGARVH
ncbi:efflux RND transporter periplasmic adaptor subunit [Sulfurimonas indica]|uniref:efflux RND transporter periplasmic adaptor subunit n=1 Tax=Sulfurimonas indica TaxID=2508707 RepID=UPI00126455C5|nr:efflux RND transporter periplasmic adaptor subunit [Sulfurimonas indica]